MTNPEFASVLKIVFISLGYVNSDSGQDQMTLLCCCNACTQALLNR